MEHEAVVAVDAIEPARVLVVDDEPGLRRGLARKLQLGGFIVDMAENGEAALASLERNPPDVALIDLRMPKMGGEELLAKAKAKYPDVEFIVMTAYADIESALSAVKAGAYHFLTKPFPSHDTVTVAVAKAAEHKRLVARARKLQEQLEAKEQYGELLGASPRMREVYRLIEGVSASTSTVLILGESGTGKELVARAIHQRSPRANKPFVTVSCAAIPKELVESELFGHMRGAFTGAQSSRAGLFETADGGTIFLDEIGDLPLAAQVKLLRTLQEGEVRRVGADESRTVDVRVLAATHVDLRSAVEAGTFRKDLFYRLNVIVLNLPPLRQRGEDVTILSYHFLQKYARRMGREVKRLTVDAMNALHAHPWPGNVRELEHAIERAVVLSRGDQIAVGDLPFTHEEVEENRASSNGDEVAELAGLPYAEAKRLAMARFEKMYIDHLLQRAGTNVSEAARLAGLDRSNFRRLVRKARES
jgi:two-component system response regulator HydG